jgi:hypothetical protein
MYARNAARDSCQRTNHHPTSNETHPSSVRVSVESLPDTRKSCWNAVNAAYSSAGNATWPPGAGNGVPSADDLECHWCGEKFRRRKSLHLRQVSASKNAFCSRGCFEEYAVLGLRHKTIPWGSKIWKCRRNLALTRDRRRCVDCGSRHKLVVHHLRPFSKFDDPDEANRLSNLATVCQSCHRKRHEQMAALTGMTVEQDTDHSS